MARKPSAKDLRALDEAQMLVYDAWEASGARRSAIAHKALAISLLCADAYVILAGAAETGSDEELVMWRKGVEAGETALGKQGFEDYAGHFWGFHETRPYMRARQGLAEALWARGERDEAIGHLQAMLELNPNDNQGLRYILAAHLVEAGRHGELAPLLERYENDDSPFLTFSAALAAFHLDGDCESSRALLRTATEANPFVAALLTGARRIPKTQPAFYSPGGEDEAVIYAQDAVAGWAAIEGAREWLGLQAGAKPARKRRGKSDNALA